MRRTRSVRSLLPWTLLVACSGSGGSTGGTTKTGGDFVVLGTTPVSGSEIFLNDVVRVTFSEDVDLTSAGLSTMSFQALDVDGQGVAELVTGTFHLGATPRELAFSPKLPEDDAFQTGGFRPGRRYLVQLVGGDAQAGTTLRARNGKGLATPFSFELTTRNGTTPAQLFANPQAGGPRRTGLEVSTTTDLDAVPLAQFGAPPLEVRLHFDQALNPASNNVPSTRARDPLTRDLARRGPVYLEYQDPADAAGSFRWLPAELELERNDDTGATLLLRPIGVLPNHATVRVIAEAKLEDIAGESSLDRLDHDRVFGTFRTIDAWQQQWNGIVEEFDAGSQLDPAAVFVEPQAEVGPGYLKAGFAFEGSTTTRDYAPTAVETVLNTSFTQVVPTEGLPFTVNGGVFEFRNVTIAAGTTVTGQGPNPLVLLCSGKVTIAGTLSVRGGNGARVDTLQSANVAKAGGVGVCGGGNGGDGTPSATLRDLQGGTGRGPLQATGRGGRGGLFACAGGCYQGAGGGSGGGGGTLATQGDPFYRGVFVATSNPNTAPTANTAFQQRLGYGGSGCSGASGTRTAFLAGGQPGDRVFVDTRADNDYWGSAIDLRRNLRITGELPAPIGGGGGGGGGDAQSAGDPVCGPNPAVPANDYSGGGGGGGGGVLIVKALDEIWITSSGRVVADGGNGGGGEQAGASQRGGGGGGGAGGMVILMSARAIRIEAHGSVAQNRFVYGNGQNGPFAGDEYSFAISADGGVCTTGGFATTVGGTVVNGKYPLAGQTMMPGASYDLDPLGGLGGLGIVQLMVPPGGNGDGTNTVLDDNILFYLPGQLAQPSQAPPPPLPAAAKRQLLAWRGFPDANGVGLDDFGAPTAIGANEGDIRPSPVLLPVPFGSRSRARSRWIDTGASVRRPLTAPDDGARGIVLTGGAEVGPRFEFAGTDPATGFVQWQPATAGVASVRVEPPVVVPSTPIAGLDADATFLGAPAYRLRLLAPGLGTSDRYAQYDAELLNGAGARLASFRILAHDDASILLDPGRALLPSEATQVRIVARCFALTTDDGDGLPGRLPLGASTAVPAANVRIGFAFHTGPNSQNPLAGRFPADSEQAFVYDLEDPALRNWLAANHPRYVQWDATFDLTYDAGAGSPPLTPNVRRPALAFLRLPFRW